MDNKQSNKLTEKQKKFCIEYIYDWNATRAAKAAGYSEATAYSIGSENLKKPEIQIYIEHLKNNLAETAGISPLMVLKEHQKLAFSSIAHLHNTWITRKEFDELTDEQKACIKSIESSVKTKNIDGKNAENQKFIDVETVKITLYDKQKSLDAINKMLGYDAPTKVDMTGSEPLQIIITKASEMKK